MTPEVEKEARNTVRDSGGDFTTVRRQIAGAEQFASILSQVRATDGSTVAGAGFTTPGGDVAYIRFTTQPDAPTEALIAQLPFTVEVQWGAPMNESELADTGAKIGKIVSQVGVSALRAGPDPSTGELVVTAHFKGDTTTSLDAAADLIRTTIAISSTPGVVIRSNPALTLEDDAGSLNGGSRLTDTQSSLYCTGGFSVHQGSTTGIVTARHCPNYLAVDGQTGIIQFASENTNSWEGGTIDLQWHRYINGYSGSAYFRSDNGVNSAVTDSANADVGQSVCHFGYGSGRQRCGEVYARDQALFFSDGVYYTGLTETTTLISTGGDSGGPWFTNGIARGIDKGNDGSSTYYVPQTQLGQALSLGLIRQ